VIEQISANRYHETIWRNHRATLSPELPSSGTARPPLQEQRAQSASST